MAEKKTKVRKAEGTKGSGKASGFKKMLTSPIATVALFAVAAVLLLASTIGGTRAALNYQSEDYIAYVALDHIGVTLRENNKDVSHRYYVTRGANSENGEWVEENGKLLQNMLGEDEKLQLGKEYPEELYVFNSGGIDEYVRVTIYKYWLYPQNEIQTAADNEQTAVPDKTDRLKMRELDPGLIKLNLVNQDVWLKDESASTSERTVLYYRDILKMGDETLPFSETLMIDPAIASKVREEVTKDGNYTTIKTIYAYDGVEFVVEVEVDAVQTHNAEDAILSAWGRRVTIQNDSLVGANGVLGSPAGAPSTPEGE